MNKYLLSTFLLLVCNCTFSQSVKTIDAQVLDSETGKPLEYASVHLKNGTLGTLTNSSGQFEFHIPTSSTDDTLQVSYIGYENFSGSVIDLSSTSSFIIRLAPKSMLLKEVIIAENDLTGKEIVQKAIKEIRNNYSKEPIRMECFFREIEWENGKCVQVTEAAVQLYDKDYNKDRNLFREEINTLSVRRSISYRQMEGYNDLGAAIVDLIENNDVRYQKGIVRTKGNEYSLDSVTYYNNRPVYIISARNRLDKATLVIDLDSFAFLKVTLERRKWDANRAPYYFNWDYTDSLKLGRVMFKYSLEFTETNGVMYPSYMMEEEIAHVYAPTSGNVSIVKKERLEMIINKIISGQSAGDFKKEKITRKYRVPVGEYDEEFWNSYTLLKLNTIDKQAIIDLENEMSINDQFKKTKNE